VRWKDAEMGLSGTQRLRDSYTGAIILGLYSCHYQSHSKLQNY